MSTVVLPGISARHSIFARGPLGPRAKMECRADIPGPRANMECRADMPGNATVDMFYVLYLHLSNNETIYVTPLSGC